MMDPKNLPKRISYENPPVFRKSGSEIYKIILEISFHKRDTL